MPCKKMLAWVTGQVEDSLRQKLAYVLAENRADRARLDRHSSHGRRTDPERKDLAEKGRPLGKLLAEVITIADSDESGHLFQSIPDGKTPLDVGMTIMR